MAGSLPPLWTLFPNVYGQSKRAEEPFADLPSILGLAHLEGR